MEEACIGHVKSEFIFLYSADDAEAKIKITAWLRLKFKYLLPRRPDRRVHPPGLIFAT